MCESGLYGSSKVAAAIIGTVDLTIGALAGEVLDMHLAAGCGRFHGIRRGSYGIQMKLQSPHKSSA